MKYPPLYCEVCERCAATMAETWVINVEGEEEGISHCFGCDPLSLPHVVACDDEED